MTSSGISDRDNGKGTSNVLERLSYSEKYLSEALKHIRFTQEKKNYTRSASNPTQNKLGVKVILK